MSQRNDWVGRDRRLKHQRIRELWKTTRLTRVAIAERVGVTPGVVQSQVKGLPRRESDWQQKERAAEDVTISAICRGDVVEFAADPIEADTPLSQARDTGTTIGDIHFVEQPDHANLERWWKVRAIKKAIERADLKTIELECLLRTQFLGETTVDVGRDLGVSRQTVLNNYRRAMVKILVRLDPEHFGYTRGEYRTRLLELLNSYLASNVKAKRYADPYGSAKWIHEAREKIAAVYP